MPSREFPNLGLTGGYSVGENGWGDAMNLNLLKLSVLSQGTFISKVNATPGTPTPGDIYAFGSTHPTNANQIAVFEGPTGSEAWTYIEPQEGWLLYNQTENYYEKFDGTVWAELETGGGGGSVAVDDESSEIISAATRLNFVGSGVTVTDGGSGEAVVTISGGSGGGEFGGIREALYAELYKDIVLNGTSLTAGQQKSIVVRKGPYVGMYLGASTDAGFASRVVGSETFTVPAGAVAFPMFVEFNDEQRNTASFYGARTFNTTSDLVAASPTSFDSNRAIPSRSPGTNSWGGQWTGMIALPDGGGSGSQNAHYPRAGVAGDVLRNEVWTAGDGFFRYQFYAAYFLILDAVTGEPFLD